MSDDKLVPAVKYPVSQGEATYALKTAYKQVIGQDASVNSLALLWAQWAEETGLGKFSWCYNFGNIKRSGDELYCQFRCNEILAGKIVWFDPPNPACSFRAYPDAASGALDYVKFLSQKSRYKTAWQCIIEGDPTKFVYALKAANYFTADVDIYLKAVLSLTNQFKSKAIELMAWQPTPITPAPIVAPPQPVVITPEPIIDPAVPSTPTSNLFMDIIFKLFSLIKSIFGK